MKLFKPRRVDDELHGITFGEFVEATPADAVEAFGEEALYDALGVPEDRRKPWHVLTLKWNDWHMAHPLTCELATCRFDAEASTWEAPPTEPGVYQWDDDGMRREGER